MPQYDALIINDDLDTAVEDVHRTIQELKNAPHRQEAFIEGFRTGLADRLKNW